MKNLLIAVTVLVCLPLTLAGQGAMDQLKDYTRQLPGDGMALTLVHLNDKTVPVLFQPPTLYSMRARAKQATSLYVQGVAEKNLELDTTNFEILQGVNRSTATPTSIRNFTKGKVKLNKGDRVDGVLTFNRLVELTTPFRVEHGEQSVEFVFTSDQVKAMTPPPAAQ